MRLRVLNIRDVAESQLCCGCGACAYVSPEEIRMVDDVEHGRRPLVRGGEGASADPRSVEAMRVCPGIHLEHTFDPDAPGLIRNLAPGWGPILGVYEGHATDPELRFSGSSGGAASALALFAIERGGMHGLLHIAARPDVPYLNHTVLSTERAQILGATGSRYAPASPCDGLQMVEDAPGPCAFIGKPCDVAGADKARAVRPALDAKLGLTVAIFCAGTPSTRGTIEMMRRMGAADLTTIVSVRYRGRGWPGNASVTFRTDDGGEETREMSYPASWGGILTKHQQWRCRICPDHTGEFADISVGDPWYRPIPPGEPGRSLVLARTERGRRMIEGAVGAGYLALEKADPAVLRASQPNLLVARGSVWGRLMALRVMGVPTPRYRRLPTARFWWSALTLQKRGQSLYGTVRRVWTKRLRHRHPVRAYEPAPEPVETRAP